MSTTTARWAFSVIAILGLGAFGLVDHDFDVNNPFFYLGLTLIVVTSVAAHGVTNATRNRSMDEMFQMGYRVGYRAGRRAALRSVPDVPVVIPLMQPKDEANEWPDTGNYPRDSSKPR